MKTIIIVVSIVMMTACASQNTMMAEYKELTKNVDCKNPQEVVLAQHLYNKMRELKYNR